MSSSPPPPYYQWPAPPQYAWPAPPPPAPLVREDEPAERAPRGWWSDRFGLIFGVSVAVVTLAAILLAVVAPSFATRPTVESSSWTVVYSGNPASDPGWMQNPGPCAMRGDGLLARGPGVSSAVDVLSSLCVYGPTQGRSLLGQGFTLDLTVAPGANVSTEQRPAVFIGDPSSGDGVLAEIGQGGGLGAVYLLCDAAGNCSSTPTIAWHTDGFVTNAFSLRYTPTAAGGTVALYGNGQQVAAIQTALPFNSALAIGAGSDASALYTGFTLRVART